MLSSVLRSPRAVQVNIEIMRAFVRLRHLLASHEELSRKLDALEKKYDGHFRVVFLALRKLMERPEEDKEQIGFRVQEEEEVYIVGKRKRTRRTSREAERHGRSASPC